jgi:hypothetical protein
MSKMKAVIDMLMRSSLQFNPISKNNTIIISDSKGLTLSNIEKRLEQIGEIDDSVICLVDTESETGILTIKIGE